MDETKFLKLRVLERTEEMIDEHVEVEKKSKFEYPHQTNPIYKNLATFHNDTKRKWSIKDLLR